MREGYFGREAEAQVMRDQVGEVGEISGGGCNVGWCCIYNNLAYELVL